MEGAVSSYSTARRGQSGLGKKSLQDALQAEDCAKKLMRTVLNSQKLVTLNAKGFRLTEYKASCHS
jgi:hypothetical protein